MSSDKPVINLFTPDIIDDIWGIDMNLVRKGRLNRDDNGDPTGTVKNAYKQPSLVEYVDLAAGWFLGIETHSRFHTSQKFRTDYDTSRIGKLYIRQPERDDGIYHKDARIYFSETADGPPIQWKGRDIRPDNWSGRYCTLKWRISAEDRPSDSYEYEYWFKPGTDYFLHFENYDRFDTESNRRTVDYERIFYLISGSFYEVDVDGNDIIPGELPPPPPTPDIVRNYDISDVDWQSTKNLGWGLESEQAEGVDQIKTVSNTGIIIPANGKILSTKFKATGGFGKERLFQHKRKSTTRTENRQREEWISLDPGGEPISNSCSLQWGSAPGESLSTTGLSDFLVKQTLSQRNTDENSCGIQVGQDYYFNMRHVDPATPSVEYSRFVLNNKESSDDVYIEDDISPEQWVANSSAVPLSKTIKKNKTMVSALNTDDDGSRTGLIEYATSAGGALVSLVSWFSLVPGGTPISNIGLATSGNKQSFQWTQEPPETERTGYIRLERNQEYFLNTKHEDPEQEESVFSQTAKTEESTYDEQFMGPGEWTGPITNEPPPPPPPPPPPSENPDWWNPSPIESFDDLVPDVVNTDALNEYVSNFNETININALEGVHAGRVISYFRDTLSNIGRYSYKDFERFGNLVAQEDDNKARQDGWVSLTQEVPHIDHLTYGTGILYIHGEMEIPPYETSPGKQIKGTDFSAVGEDQYIRSPIISTTPEEAQNLYFKQDPPELLPPTPADHTLYPWNLGYLWDFKKDSSGPSVPGTNGSKYWYYNTILNEVGAIGPDSAGSNNIVATGYNDASLYLVDNERNNFPWVVVNSGAPESVSSFLDAWKNDKGMYDNQFPSYCQPDFPPISSGGINYKSGKSITYILDFISPLKIE